MRQVELDLIESKILDGETERVELLFDNAYVRKAIECVSKAKRSVLICAYAWRWYENAPEKDIQKLNYAIAKASSLGIDIRVILDQQTQASQLRAYGIASRTLPTDRAMHSKVMLIDEECLLLGSHNLTERGTVDNYEISVAIRDTDACLLFKEYFEAMWQNYARE